MKLVPSLLAAAVLAVSITGCTSASRNSAEAAPAIDAVASHKIIQAGESTRITAHTANLVGGTPIRWMVTPNVARLQPDSRSGQTVIFTADQPGQYVVTAQVQDAAGRNLESSTNITVNGAPITSDRSAERWNNNNNPNYPNNNPPPPAPAPNPPR